MGLRFPSLGNIVLELIIVKDKYKVIAEQQSNKYKQTYHMHKHIQVFFLAVKLNLTNNQFYVQYVNHNSQAKRLSIMKINAKSYKLCTV